MTLPIPENIRSHFEPLVKQRTLVPKDLLGDHADVYAVDLAGDCMEPHFERGDILFISPSAEPRCGDFVVFYPVKDGQRPQLKRLVLLPFRWDAPANGTIMPITVFEQTNPPKRYAVAIDRIQAAHKVIARMSVASDPGWTDDGLYQIEAEWGRYLDDVKVRTKKGTIRVEPCGRLRYSRNPNGLLVRKVAFERFDA